MITGDLDRAIADYEAMLKIEPNNADAMQELEQVRQMRNQR